MQIADLFGIFQTEQRLKRDNVNTEKEACDTHKKIGKIVRKAIKEAGRNYARRFTYTTKKFKTIRKRKQEKLKKVVDNYVDIAQ